MRITSTAVHKNCKNPGLLDLPQFVFPILERIQELEKACVNCILYCDDVTCLGQLIRWEDFDHFFHQAHQRHTRLLDIHSNSNNPAPRFC